MSGRLLSAGLLIAVGLLWAVEVWAESGHELEPKPEPPPTFVTWTGLEPDKCASIWLIRRHIAPEARFRFFEPDTEAPPGIPFDTPDAQLRRYQSASTYQTLASHYKIAGHKVAYIGRLMHDIEINTWARKALPETREIEARLMSLLETATPQGAIDRCSDFFDQLEPASASVADR